MPLIHARLTLNIILPSHTPAPTAPFLALPTPPSCTTIHQHIIAFPKGSTLIPRIHFALLPFHHGPTRRNIVLDCLADAIIPGLYLHNHISHLHSWALTEARQVKHHTPGDKTTEAHLELRPGLSSAPRHYWKRCWPFIHLASCLLLHLPTPRFSSFIF